MARTTSVPNALGRARNNLGLSLFDVAVKLRDILPPAYWGSTEKIRRYEAGMVPVEEMDPIFLQGLAEVLCLRLSELSPAAEEQIETLRGLTTRPKGRGSDARSRWTVPSQVPCLAR